MAWEGLEQPMDRITTQNCKAHGHLELALAYDPAQVLESDVRWFASTLEWMVGSGSRFGAGESVQLGWSALWVSEMEDGVLGFEEPDMRSMPVMRQPGLTQTLRHLRLHKDVVESVLPADAAAFPSFRQACLVCTRLASSAGFIMDRQNPADADSGWFIGCRDKDHSHNQPDNLEKVSLYEAAIVHCPAALPYLALPAGILVAFDRMPTIFKDRQALNLRRGSFLDRLLGSR